MKGKYLCALIVALGCFMFVAAGVLTATDVPDEVIIENSGYKKDKKGPVLLTHKKHSVDYKVACTDCHHEYEDGKNVWKEGDPVKKCSECHNPKKKEGKVLKLQNAYHKQCKTCHKNLVKEGKGKAPFKKCSECHQKKKKT